MDVVLGVEGRIRLGAARFRLTGRRAPLVAWIAVTNRCEALCAHCVLPMRTQRELTSRELHALVDDLADRGCQAVVLTGGEPLVREDIAAIVTHCAARGLHVRLETNGYRYVERAVELAGVGHLVVGYEGDADVHDRIREPGSWAQARGALVEARRRGLRTSTLTVLTRHNVLALDRVLACCEALGASAEIRLLAHDPAVDGVAACELAPDDADIRRALQALVTWRREGRPVGHSERTLRALTKWDDFRHPTSARYAEEQVCLAGMTHCFVDADGTMYTCRSRATAGGNVKDGFDAAFEPLRQNGCRSCAAPDLCERNS